MSSAVEGRLLSPGWPGRASIWAATGILYGLAFPKFDLTFLAWIALVPALWAARTSDRPTREIFLGAFGAGLLGNLFIYFWFWPTFMAAKIDFASTLVSWSIVSGILALYFGVFSLFYRALPTPTARIWLGATAWVALDEVRSVVLTGFPWALLSHSQVSHPTLIQIASVTGSGGITFLIVAVNGALAETADERRAPGRLSGRANLALVIGLLAGVLAWGTLRLKGSAAVPMRPLRVSILQGNIDQYRKWDDAYEADIRATYYRLAMKGALKAPDVMLWPESSVPAYLPSDEKYVRWMVGIASATAVPHLFGSLSEHGKHEYNSAFVMRPNGQLEGQYNKRHLVPFGEYVPLAFLLTHLAPYLGQVGTFDPGTSEKIFEIKGIRLSPNICYEAMFPGLVRLSALEADVIVNLTNDGWFLNSGGPHQDYSVNILRAVENGRPVVRSANTGISAIIDAFGRVLLETPLMVEGEYSGTVPVPPLDFRTIYGRGHNWFGWLCGLTGLGALGWVLVRRRSETPIPS